MPRRLFGLRRQGLKAAVRLRYMYIGGCPCARRAPRCVLLVRLSARGIVEDDMHIFIVGILEFVTRKGRTAALPCIGHSLRKKNYSCPRRLRTGIKMPQEAPTRRKRPTAVTRVRKGSITSVADPWRRCKAGTNPISCFGIWRQGARRLAPRLNCKGDTRWRLPYHHLADAISIVAGDGR